MPSIFEYAFAGNVDVVRNYLNANPTHVDLADEGGCCLMPFLASITFGGKKVFGAVVAPAIFIANTTSAPTAVVASATNPPAAVAFAFGTALIVGSTYVPYTIADADIWYHSFNRKGWTLLHYAAAGGQMDVIALLIERGANREKRDALQRSFLTLAEQYGTGWVVGAVNTLLNLRAQELLVREERVAAARQQGVTEGGQNQLQEIRRQVNAANARMFGAATATQTSATTQSTTTTTNPTNYRFTLFTSATTTTTSTNSTATNTPQNSQ